MVLPVFPRRILFLPLLLVALASCSGPAHRIRRDPALFATFPPGARARIEQGRIELGFSPDMVRMALGEPDRRTLRLTAAGESEAWIYEGRRPRPVPVEVLPVHSTRSRVAPLYYLPVTETTWDPYDRARVEFADGKVSAIEGSP